MQPRLSMDIHNSHACSLTLATLQGHKRDYNVTVYYFCYK